MSHVYKLLYHFIYFNEQNVPAFTKKKLRPKAFTFHKVQDCDTLDALL